MIGDAGRVGRPLYPTELMIRLLVEQSLSDDAMEYQLPDRASFQHFAGIDQSGWVPDAKTLWVWREQFRKQDLIGDISEAAWR